MVLFDMENNGSLQLQPNKLALHIVALQLSRLAETMSLKVSMSLILVEKSPISLAGVLDLKGTGGRYQERAQGQSICLEL